MSIQHCSRCQKPYATKIHICYAPLIKPAVAFGENKQKLGQFFTTNYQYILQGLTLPSVIERLVEPFAGNGDLLQFLTPEQRRLSECYDIEVRHPYITQRDTITQPPNYTGSYVLTNPPYLARNKSAEKAVFDRYDVNDLYKCFLKELITNSPLGGIVIVPLNFWSSVRKADAVLRHDFLTRFTISRINIFEETVFSDTTTTVCSFQFTLREGVRDETETIPLVVYPKQLVLTASFTASNQYLLGGEIYTLPMDKRYTITRLTTINSNSSGRTNLLVKCIDDNLNAQISLSVVPDDKVYVDETANHTARTYATLVIEPPLAKEQQVILADRFNCYLAEQRTRYHSLFLSNFRESKDLARKRISFDLVYRIVGYLLRE